jgi:hypothetical protein
MNKKWKLILGFFLILPMTALSAPLDNQRNMEIAVNPLLLVTGRLPIVYRLGLTQKMALSFYGGLRTFSWGEHGAATQMFGLNFDIGPKFYLSGKAFTNSWYIEPSFGVSYYSFNDTVNIGPSVVAGYGWVFDSGFSVSLGVGMTYNINLRGKTFYNLLAGTGLLPTAEVSLGYVW